MRYGMVINLNRCVGCDSCAVACKQHSGTPKGVFWSKVLRREKGKYPNSWMHYQPMLCMHCQNPECVQVCPTGASHQRQDGIVAIDQDKCIGCQYCIMACPYGARTKLVQIQPYYPSNGFVAVEKASHRGQQLGVVGKCNFCSDRLEKGLEPACVQACPGIARIFGDLEDPNSEVARMVGRRNVKQLRPEVGTDPCVYYIEVERK